MRALRARGVAIIFVSHRLAEVFAIADRIVVMRDGRIRGDHDTAATTRDASSHEMVGRAARSSRIAGTTRGGPVAQAVSRLRVARPHRLRSPMVAGRRVVDDARSSPSERGEILGLFGLLGAGCVEIGAGAVRRLARPRQRATSLVDGDQVVIRTAGRMPSRCGIGLMAQDRRDACRRPLDRRQHRHRQPRRRSSAVASSTTRCAGASRHGTRSRSLSIKAPRSTGEVRHAVRRQPAEGAGRALAGGRRARSCCSIDPTRGVDVGARGEIKRSGAELAARGLRASLLVSSDAEELVEVCDRVMVLRGGRIAGELVAATT